MRKIQKIFIKIILISLFILICLGIKNNAYARSYSIDDMDMQVTILENGSINVKQSITYNFRGSFNGIYITVPYTLSDKEQEDANKKDNSIYNGNSVTINSVYDSKGRNYSETEFAYNGDRNVYTLSKDTSKYTLKVFSPSQDTIKTFTLDYNINNVCVKYVDVGELYYNFIGGKWDVAINNLNIDVYLPNNNFSETLYAFGHGPYNGKVTIESSNKVNFKVKNVKKGEYVAARVVFDKDNIKNSAKKIDKTALSEIMQEEKNIYENKAEKEKFNQKLLVFAIILFVYWIVLLFVFEKDKKYITANASEQELFEKYNPLIAGCIQGSREVLSRDIIAVILNLIDKKIINMSVRSVASIKETYIYDLSVEEDKRGKMDEIESFICNWLFKDKNTIDLQYRLKQMTKEKEANDKFKQLNKMAKSKLNKIGANIPKVPMSFRMFNTFILLISVILVIIDISNNQLIMPSFGGKIAYYIVIAVIELFFIVPIVMYIPIYLLIATRHRVNKLIRRFTGQKVATTAVSIILIFLVIILLTMVLAKEAKFLIIDEILLCISLIIVLTDNLMLQNNVTIIEDYSKLNMLKHKLEDDKLFEDRDVGQVILWGKYLAYSVAFGTSSKIAKKMKELHVDDDLERLLEDKKMLTSINNGYIDFYNNTSLERRFLRNYGKFASKMASAGFSGGGGRRIFTAVEVILGGGGSGRRRPEHSNKQGVDL